MTRAARWDDASHPGLPTLNMYLERDIDGRTRQTRTDRHRLGDSPKLALGLEASHSRMLALLWLGLLVNTLTAVLGLLAPLCRRRLDTPMKQVFSGALVVRAVPGAMPPPWAGQRRQTSSTSGTDAVCDHVPDGSCRTLSPDVAILDIDCRRAGFKTLVSELGTTTAKFQVVLYLLLLCPVSLLLVSHGHRREAVFGQHFRRRTRILGGRHAGAAGIPLASSGPNSYSKASLLYLMVVSAQCSPDRPCRAAMRPRSMPSDTQQIRKSR